jgi:membrane protease YdiL (CAAX protease family)
MSDEAATDPVTKEESALIGPASTAADEATTAIAPGEDDGTLPPPPEPSALPEPPEQMELAGLVGSTGQDNGAGLALGFDSAEPGEGLRPFVYSPPELPVVRTPNIADAALFLLLLLLGLLVTMGSVGVALHFHWFGLRNFAEAENKTWLTLGTQVMLYAVGLAGAVPFFRMAWRKGYFEGLHWHAMTALQLRYRLLGMAFLCNVLAMIGNWMLPFPDHAPIDRMFGSATDAWLLMSFGVLVAPFFEEMIFRGFLLPAVATSWDWSRERLAGDRPRPLDAQGNPVWSAGAMIIAALVVSVPFALMHSAQLGSAWGPLLLLYCISLILCAVRLATRSLAASTLVHSAYNFMLFALMLIQTGGFRHMDKM